MFVFSGPEGMFPATEDDFLNEKVQKILITAGVAQSKENHYPCRKSRSIRNSDVQNLDKSLLHLEIVPFN